MSKFNRPTARGEINETDALTQTGYVTFSDDRKYKFWYHADEAKIYWDNDKGKTTNIWNGKIVPPTDPNVPSLPPPPHCPIEHGFCVTQSGADQNSGVIKFNSYNGNTVQRQQECLKHCLAQPGATGCEVIWDQNNRGCYVHTQQVARGNNVARHRCWIFSKCRGPRHVPYFPPPPPPPRSHCPMERGFCVTQSGADQNSGVIKFNSYDGNTVRRQQECLKRCLAHPGATGCEVIWDQSNRGCYVHTQHVARGNNVARHHCWIFSKCRDNLSHRATVCEHKRKTISCPPDFVIQITQANYGRTSKNVCVSRAMMNSRCHSGVSLSKVKHLCQRRRSCELFASNSVFGDPCFGTYKYLDVHYQCVRSAWLLQQRNVCFGARGNQYGRFTVKHPGQLTAIKLVHRSGFVSCRNGPPRGNSNWGCAPNLKYLSTAVTDGRNSRIFPKSLSNTGWYTMGGYSANSRELVFEKLASPMSVGVGKEMRLWYGEDLVGYTEGDNHGRTCADVYAKILQDGTAPFNEVGCYKDERSRAISGGKVNFPASLVIQKCYEKARDMGHEYFAVQYNVECFTSHDAGRTYSRYGRASGCKNGRGGTWMMTVYKINLRVDNSIKFPQQQRLTRNSLLTTIPKWGKIYSVKFQVYPIQFARGWTNVIHFTSTNRNCCNNGDRVPGVWFHSASPKDRVNKLHVCSSVNKRGNHCYNSPMNVRLGKWTTVEIKQYLEGSSYRYEVRVNGARIGTALNRAPQEFTNVKAYASDPWYNTARGHIRGLIIQPAEDMSSREAQKVHGRDGKDGHHHHKGGKTWKIIGVIAIVLFAITLFKLIKYKYKHRRSTKVPSNTTQQGGNQDAASVTSPTSLPEIDAAAVVGEGGVYVINPNATLVTPGPPNYQTLFPQGRVSLIPAPVEEKDGMPPPYVS